ncbi:hypothetical protein N7532_004196 [Penicillium argentinense]|uniref:Uncharacterized protein n=1 Tax=Penicillium argentinense TaxID=1131581 RepID=A0A9W9KFX6_9EURO|nr:uncharacterized protein N7532_004196 [Penicillium argentinense]KAJ5103667.1 hypothetical protein N7532_004196 [Penicillium argentinense]
MSTPKTDRVSLARHHHPHSPFGRAGDASHEFDFEPSTFPSPSKQNGTRPRHNYRTGTLAGAYRAVSRTSMSDEGHQLGSNTSPRQTRPWEHLNAPSPTSDTSNPPAEPVDAYRKIDEIGTLADNMDWEDLNGLAEKRSPGRLNRSSSKQRGLYYDTESRFSEASLLDEMVHNSPRRRKTNYSRDEERLRRVTGKDSAIFSKAKVGSRTALTADNLQRREEEIQHDQHQEQQPISEDDGEQWPSLNLPRSWGSRAARPQEWLRNVSGSSASESQEKKAQHDPPSNIPATSISGERTTSRTTRSSPRPERDTSSRPMPTRGALEERVANLHASNTEESNEKGGLGLNGNTPQIDGNAIPNTPIIVYKNSTLTRPSAAKRDSQDLLRKLSRAESPKMDQVQTPEPPKLFERKVYDKTPRVTGAWIDTPMTERVTEIPSDLTKDIVPPAAPPQEKEVPGPEPIAGTKPTADVMPKSEEPEAKNENRETNSGSETRITKRSKPKPPLVRPNLPKSALETVIEDVHSGKEALDLGDDTIESLQAIMDDPTEVKSDEEEEATYEQKLRNRLELATKNQDHDEYDRIENKLHSLTKHIEEVKKGLDRLEDHLGGIVTDGLGDSATNKQTSDSTLRETSNTQPDTRIYAAIPLPRLWERNPTSRRLRITKLGWTTLIFLTWYIIECQMTEMYSHPLISNTCTGYCLRPDAPIFPFVTVTMLWRLSHLSTLLTPIITIGIAIFRLVAQLLGLWDGYVDEPERLGKLVGEIRINGTAVPFPWLTPPSTATSFVPPPAAAAAASPPPPQAPVWTARHEIPVNPKDEQASMDDDEYL